MGKGLLVLSAVIAVLLGKSPACDLCAIYSATQARGEVGAGWIAGLAEQWTHFGTLQEEGREVPNPTGQHLDSSISQLFAGYNFQKRFSVQFNLPLIYRAFKRPEGFNIEHGTEAGVGDISLIGNWRAYSKLAENFSFRGNLFGGIKFPTGSTRRLQEELNEMEITGAPISGIHGHDLTLGSGSIDGVIGGHIFTTWKRSFLTADLQYAIRTEGDFGYRFANDLMWSGGPGMYLLLEHPYTLALQAVVSGESKGRDTFRGEKVGDTGVTSVYLGPQIHFTWSNKLSAQAGVDLPVSLQNTGFQAVPDYRVRAGAAWHF